MSFSRPQRRRNVIHRRDGRPWSGRGWMNTECRVLRNNQRSRREVFLFKPESMAFCPPIAQVQNMRLLFRFKQMSGGTMKKRIQQHESPLSRSLRDCRIAGNSERRRRPSKASGLTQEGDGEAVTFPPIRMSASRAVCTMCFSSFYVLLSAKFP